MMAARKLARRGRTYALLLVGAALPGCGGDGSGTTVVNVTVVAPTPTPMTATPTPAASPTPTPTPTASPTPTPISTPTPTSSPSYTPAAGLSGTDVTDLSAARTLQTTLGFVASGFANINNGIIDPATFTLDYPGTTRLLTIQHDAGGTAFGATADSIITSYPAADRQTNQSYLPAATDTFPVASFLRHFRHGNPPIEQDPFAEYLYYGRLISPMPRYVAEAEWQVIGPIAVRNGVTGRQRTNFIGAYGVPTPLAELATTSLTYNSAVHGYGVAYPRNQTIDSSVRILTSTGTVVLGADGRLSGTIAFTSAVEGGNRVVYNLVFNGTLDRATGIISGSITVASPAATGTFVGGTFGPQSRDIALTLQFRDPTRNVPNFAALLVGTSATN